MHGKSEPAERFSSCIVGWRSFKAFLRSFEPQAQGESFVHVTDFPQQSSDAVGAFEGIANEAKRNPRSGFAGLHGLEQGALELLATHGSVGINTAAAAVERGARLREFVFCASRFAAFYFGHGYSERFKFRSVIAGSEFNIFEQHAVAAQSAVRA